MTKDIQEYLIDGCGRCSKFRTDACKVRLFPREIETLRKFILETGLKEEMKWGYPTYTLNGKNLAILTTSLEKTGLSFFKGELLKDELNLLTRPGENSQSYKLMLFNSLSEILANEEAIKAYLFEAIDNENAGLKVVFKKIEEYDVPEEIQEKLNTNEEFRSAFEALTPGRKRSYYLHISGAKQAATRTSRLEKCWPKIKAGKGFNEY